MNEAAPEPRRRIRPLGEGSGMSSAGTVLGGGAERSIASGAAAQTPATGQTAPRKAREVDIANGILKLEREARNAETEAELGYLMVNGSRVAVRYRQALLLMRSGPKKHRAVAVSSLTAIDRNSTFIRWIEKLAERELADADAKVRALDARASSRDGDLDASAYPFAQFAFVPLTLRDGTVFAHMLFTREGAWDEAGLTSAARLCETFSHSWEALNGPAKAKRRLKRRTLLWTCAGAALALLAILPVPLSVLAPAEVTPARPFVVAAPIDGTVEAVAVEPNSRVAKGDLLFTFNDTELRNRVRIAGEAIKVAEARYQQSLRTSFTDERAKRELAIAQSELKLKAAEYDYAKELLDKARAVAPRDGLVLFASRDEWTGRPVATGERIMRIADPAEVDLTVRVPVADAVVLTKGAQVDLYLDAAPLNAISATLVSASFHAAPDAEDVLSYTVRARFDEADGGAVSPRLGLRGTAKVHGETVMLAYHLFRKPLAVIRQWAGL